MFTNSEYASDLSQLLTCREMSQSFYKKENNYDSIVNALKLSNELAQTQTFLTQKLDSDSALDHSR